MDLRTYLKQPGKTQQKLADALGVSQGLIFQWLAGTTRITPDRAMQIERATQGDVTCEAMIPEFTWERDRKGRVIAYRVHIEPRKSRVAA